MKTISSKKGKNMRAQKAVSLLATLSILSFAVACNSGGGGSTTDRYQEGFNAGRQSGYNEGYDVGYDDGYADGDAAGYARAEAYFSSLDYNQGFADGRASGLQEGYNNGYSVGKNDGLNEGYANGYNAGYDDGDADGFDRGYNVGYDDGYTDGDADGYTAGYNTGYSDGYDDGSFDGYNLGYDDGFADGYDVGYDDGFNDGYGLSVGPSPKLLGYADVLSAFHNDLIDYSKIKAPKQTKRGLVANGRLILSEVSMTNKDTLKRAAAVEQYLVIEMAKQVKGKFGLSAERSLKVAKAANHFRKYASKRALTSEDTNAYAKELVGVDFGVMSDAFENSKKGDLSGLNAIIEKAAEKNEVSPEKMSEIMASMFL